MKTIDSLQIPVDYIAGTSMGGIIGGLYSIGCTTAEIESLATNANWDNLLSDTPPRGMQPYLERINSGRYQVALRMRGFVPSIPSGLVSGQKIMMMLTELSYSYSAMESFDNLPIPFRCVAVDLITGNEVVLNQGSLAKAMRSTMSVPTIFHPVDYGDSLLIDGGVLNNFPTDIVRRMGADIIIGLNLKFSVRGADSYDNLLDVLDRTTEIPRQARLQNNITEADIYIESDVSALSVTDFSSDKIPEIIAQGRKASEANLDNLVKLRNIIRNSCVDLSEEAATRCDTTLIEDVILSTNSLFKPRLVRQLFPFARGDLYDSTRVAEAVRGIRANPRIKNIRHRVIPTGANTVNIHIDYDMKSRPVLYNILIEGSTSYDFKFLTKVLGVKPGDRFDPDFIRVRIDELYSLGYFDKIYYEVSRVNDTSVALIINFKEKPTRRLYIGMRYDEYHELVGMVGLQLMPFYVTGLRFETELQFAGLTRYLAKFSYLSRSLSYPAYPYAIVKHKDIGLNIYDEFGEKTARYNDRSTLIGLGLGIFPDKSSNLEFEYNVELMDVSAEIASADIRDLIGDFDDVLSKYDIKLDIDRLDNVLLPRDGLKLTVLAELSYEKMGSEHTYQKLDIRGDYYYTLGRHTMRLAGTHKRGWNEFPIYKWYYLGGPDEFVGWNYSKFSGNRFNSVRAEYRYEHKKDIFFKFILNAAFDYSLGFPEYRQSGPLLTGVGIGVKFTSLVGPLEIMVGNGDENLFEPGKRQNLFYFTAGYKF
ncbi:MAG: BamA/TamA family outer membrane protein [candidate division Zixibacteria bacterium]|nr:BamA/TamA family outer membrane protein [candidate division Zixibacteria bacterium]